MRIAKVVGASSDAPEAVTLPGTTEGSAKTETCESPSENTRCEIGCVCPVSERTISITFLKPAGNADHHALFLIQTPPFMKGCEHFTFHMGGPTEVMLAGTRFVNKGYQSFWGPGRHKMGSNWFWYFNSPLGCHVEYDADMDSHDAAWTARAVPMSADASQLFLFERRDKWVPGGPPAGAGERH